MGLLSKFAEFIGWPKGQELVFRWTTFPDSLRPGVDIHTCDLPDGAYFLVQEVSAPDPQQGHIGWQLMDRDSTPVEMRNGFYEVDKAKAHAEEHFRTNYAR